MWSMQSYQHQAEEVRQQYSNLVAQKEYEVQCCSIAAVLGRNFGVDQPCQNVPALWTSQGAL